MELQELLQTIAEELPPQASCINAIEGAELTWLKVRTSTDVEYATLEALRLDWQTRAGREIAIETFRYSPELDPMVIRTVMGITPSVPIIQAILLSENDGQKRLTIHTTDMRMLLGRQYQIYHALCGFLPEYEIILAPARSDWRSPNLPAVQQVLFDSKGDHELLKKVRKQLPHDLQVTHVGVNKYGTLHVFYMNWQMPGGELWKIRRELSATFNRNVYFALDVRWAKKLIGPYLEDGIEVYVCRDRIIRIMPRFDRLNPQTIASARRIAAKAYEELGLPIVVGVGSRRLIADLYSMLPLMVMQSGEAIIRQDRITGTITITCTSEVHRRLLEEFAQEMSPQLHLPIRVVMLLKATERNQLIRKLVPTAWGLKKALWSATGHTTVLRCATPPDLSDPATEQVFATIRDRTGYEPTINATEFTPVTDEILLQEVRNALPPEAEMVGLEYRADTGKYRIVFAKFVTGSLKYLKGILGSVPDQITVKVPKPKKVSLPRAAKRNVVQPTFLDAPPSMYLTGLGACERVGKSCFYLKLSDLNILLDFGASYEDGDSLFAELTDEQVLSLHYVVLTHGHGDHSVGIPLLYDRGCQAQLIATGPTLAISRLLMRDFLQVQSRYRGETPPYDQHSITNMFEHASVVSYGERLQLGLRTFITFLNAGHILGSAMVLLEDGDKRFLYTGDASCLDTRTLKGAVFPSAHYILTEATYGASAHADRQTVETEFLDKIIDVLAKGGSVLIPSFAVGRAQEVLAILATRPEFAQGKYPVFIDGMIAKMNAIYDAYSQSGQDHSLNPDLPSGLLGKDSFWRSVKNRGALLKASQPKVILSTSGMLEGPALDYLKAMINNDANMVVIVGYQPEGRLGRQLLAGDEEVEISGKNRLVKIQVYQAAFSAHADRVQLVEQIAASGSELRAVYGIHGEGHAIRKLMKAVQERLPHVTAEPLQAGKTYSL